MSTLPKTRQSKQSVDPNAPHRPELIDFPILTPYSPTQAASSPAQKKTPGQKKQCHLRCETPTISS